MAEACAGMPDVLIGKFMTLTRDPQNVKKLTPTYTITANRGGAHLGAIKWYGAWRGFCFFAGYTCIFDGECLGQIREWIQTLDAAYKAREKCGDKKEAAP